MWLSGKRKLTLHARDLDEVLGNFEQDRFLIEWTDQVIKETTKNFPILTDIFASPQSANKHAEGPLLEDHVRKILMTLYALVEGRFSLLEVEEFRRMKGYEGEFEELEETIKERAGMFKVYALIHDIGKAATISFSAPEGSKGAEYGFAQSVAIGWDDFAGDQRFSARKKYDDLYATFAVNRSGQDQKVIQAEFFREFQISISNHGHARLIFAPELNKVVRALAKENRLPENDIDLLEELIAVHMDTAHYFWGKADPQDYAHFVEYSAGIGQDADDFLDLLQAAAFLDKVCGSWKLSAGGYWHSCEILTNFLQAEHDYAPWRREAAEERRAKRELEKRREIYRQVGLDG
ncbi:MAG: hypothetical protein ABIH67_04800, partial [Candidatus Uhrbacteria bacterium]